MGIYSFYGKLNRYRQIVEVLSHHQLGYMVDLLGFSRFSSSAAKQRATKTSDERVLNKWARTRMVLEELGGTFIKMGQILSTRGDLLPAELIEELEKLQDHVPSFPFDEAKKIIEKELNSSMDELFLKFEQQPFASASLGQVHNAVLKPGDEVVVKVQRPEIKSGVNMDSEILLDAARFLERRRLFKGQYNFVPIAQEIKDCLEEETDYLREAHNAERFRKNFASDPTVYVPSIIWGLTTTRMLCMEKVVGTKILHIEQLREKGLDPAHIARVGATAYMKQILVHGFFHADPHPGNLFITKEGKIAFVDFGLVGEIDIDMRNKLGDLCIGIVNGNIDAMIDALFAMGSIPPLVDRIRLKKDLNAAYNRYSNLPLKDIKMGEAMKDMMNLMYSYQVKILPDFMLMIKTIVMLEAIGRQLDPDFNIIEIAEPFTRELIRERMMSRWWFSDSFRAFQGFFNNLNDLIRQLSGTHKILEKGELKIRHEHLELQRMANRLCYSIIVAAVIIGSSWLTAGPSRFSFFGLIGFAISAFLGFLLLLSIMRSGKV